MATEDQDDNCVLIPFLALLWMPPEYCRQQVQSEPVPHLLIPRRLYDNQRVNRLLEKLAVKLSEIYPDSFLLSTHPLRLKYRNQPYHWWQISLPHFVNLVQRILCIDSGDLIEAGMSLTVSSHAIWRQTQEPKLNMSSGIAAYEYHELTKKESASGENFWANVIGMAAPVKSSKLIRRLPRRRHLRLVRFFGFDYGSCSKCPNSVHSSTVCL